MFGNNDSPNANVEHDPDLFLKEGFDVATRNSLTQKHHENCIILKGFTESVKEICSAKLGNL